MFGNIRRKFNDVIQEGRSNLSTSYLRPSSSQTFDGSLGVPSDINLSAGCRLLEKNESIWRSLHEASEQNADHAENIDERITGIKVKTEKLYVDVTDMNVCLTTIPAIVENLKTCTQIIENVGKLCQSFETKLVELEDVTEELDLQQRQLDHKFQMSMYKQKKMAQLEEVRMKLSRKYAENVDHYENQLKKIQQERQAVFQDAFQNDLQIYRERGSIPKVEHIKKNSLVPELSLEEITLDDSDNKNELEDFLKD